MIESRDQGHREYLFLSQLLLIFFMCDLSEATSEQGIFLMRGEKDRLPVAVQDCVECTAVQAT